MDPSFRIRGQEFGSDTFLGLRTGTSSSVRVALVGRHLLRAFTRKKKRISAEAELYAAALGAPEEQGVQSMMRDLGFVVKPVLIIDAKATEHILHRRGIGKMKHIDVAHLWLQDEVKSNRFSVRRVKSEDNIADTGTEALSNKIIRNHATSMRHPCGTLVLKRTRSQEIAWGSGLANQSKQISAVKVSRKRHWNQLVAMPDSSSISGSEGRQVSARVTKRDDSKPGASPSCDPFPHKRIVMDSYSS